MITDCELIEVSAAAWPRQYPDDRVDLPDRLRTTASATAGALVANPSAAPDPRQPTRLQRVNPTPEELVCEPAQRDDIAPDNADDPLVAARGMVVGLLLSVPLWAVIGLSAWFVL
jgi:hypothetical protein